MNQFNDNTLHKSILKIDIQVYNSHCLDKNNITWHASILVVSSLVPMVPVLGFK